MKPQANTGIHCTAVFISVLSISARAEDCNELLRLGYMNINHSVSQYDSVVSAYNHFCSTSYDSASSDQKRGLQASFDFLKTISGSLGFNWGKTLTQETWSQICEDVNTYNKLSTYQSVDSSEISSTALSAWQNCLTLTARGLKTDFSPTQDLTGLTGALYWTGSSPINFLGVDNIGLGKANCEVTAYIGNKYVTQTVTPSTTFKLSTKAANFNCQRITELDAKNRITAQATRLTFKTSDGKLDFDLAPITLTQIESKQISGLYKQIASLGDRTKALETFATATASNAPVNMPVLTALANGTVYQNTSKHKYLVSYSCNSTGENSRELTCAAGSEYDNIPTSHGSGNIFQSVSGGGRLQTSCIVPSGYYYKVSWNSGNSVCSGQVWEM